MAIVSTAPSLGRPQPWCEWSLSWWLESVEVACWDNKNQLKANNFFNNLADAILLVQLDALALLVWPVRVKTTWARPNNRASKTDRKPAAAWAVGRGACGTRGQRWIAVYLVCPKTCRDGGKLGVHFLSIGSVKFGGSLVLGTCAGAGLWRRRAGSATSLVGSLIKMCRRAPGSSGTTSLSLASGCLRKTVSASWTTWSLWRKNGTGTSGTLLAMTGAVSLMMLLADKMQQGSIVSMGQMIAFLESATVELFVWYARVSLRNIVRIRSKIAVKGWFAAQRTRFLVFGLAVSCFSVFAQALKARD